MTDEAPAGNDDGTATDRERRLQKAANRREFDSGALERAHEDAHLVLEQTFQLFSDLSDEAFRLIRLNALILTILTAVASQITVIRYVNVPTVAALLLFLASASFGLVAYLTTTVTRGFDASIVGKPTKYKLRETEYLNWILTRAYPKWINDGIRKVNRKERWLRLSLVAFIAGVTTLVVGILFTLY